MSDFLGAPYPITKHSQGYFHTQDNFGQIKSDLLVLLLTNPGSRCLTGDTLIPLANGTNVKIMDLVDKPSFWVYSYDLDAEHISILPGKATAYKTLENAELLEITLDNNEVVKCTPNHLWLLRNGEYRAANELKVYDSLMPLYRHLNTGGYERIYQPELWHYIETHRCFVEGRKLTGVREAVHHKDLNKLNNSPDNLQWMTFSEHTILHNDLVFNDPILREERIQKIQGSLIEYYETHDGNRKGVILSEETRKKLSDNKNAFYETEDGAKLKELLREKALEQFKDGSPWKGQKHTEETKLKMSVPRPSIVGDNNPSKRPEVREKLKAAWVERRLKNHKVASIKKLDYREDCYDLNVEKYHNFALSAGVFVHNCMLPTFGTPLRTLIFEPNNAILQQKARQMIIQAIKDWEPRVSIDQIDVSSTIDRADLNTTDDLTEQNSILHIRIRFKEFSDITEVQELVLQVPLGA